MFFNGKNKKHGVEFDFVRERVSEAARILEGRTAVFFILVLERPRFITARILLPCRHGDDHLNLLIVLHTTMPYHHQGGEAGVEYSCLLLMNIRRAINRQQQLKM